MEALRIISDEHQALASILHAIRFMLKEVGAGRLAPDLKLFQAMVHYLDAYAEQRHHPREDPLFIRLAERSPEAADALARLAEQHAAAPARIAVLQQALEAYIADPARFEAFAQAFDDYAEFYRGHIMLEESAVLPRLRTHLDAADWAAAEAEFQADMASRDLAAQEDFAGLFSKLVACAPAPIGFGPRPFTD